MSRWVACAVAALWLSSCQGQANAPAATTATTTTAGDEAEPDAIANTTSGDAREATPQERALIDELLRGAEATRQLKLRTPVRIEIEGVDAIARSLRAQIDEADIERARLIYGSLGLLDTDSDIRGMFAGVLGEQVIGYYDPETQRLVVRDSVMEAMAGDPTSEATQEGRLILVHELVHALQDQRLGLGESYEKERTADADNAFRSVVEGDATLAMLAYALRQQGIPLSAATEGIQQMGSKLDLNALVRGEKLDEAPAIVRVTLVAPYLRGLQFSAAVQGRGGWPAINNAHRRPPISSEQVLHPEKYFSRERAERVEVAEHPGLISAGFERVEEDTLGELELSVYLGQNRASDTDEVAAAGWAGDRLVVYRRNDELAAVWWTTWDTERDAKEAFRAAQAVSSGDARAIVVRRGRGVLIVRGLPRKLHGEARDRFDAFARALESRPAPPTLRPSPVY